MILASSDRMRAMLLFINGFPIEAFGNDKGGSGNDSPAGWFGDTLKVCPTKRV